MILDETIVIKDVDPDQPDEEVNEFTFEDAFESDDEGKKRKKRKKIE